MVAGLILAGHNPGAAGLIEIGWQDAGTPPLKTSNIVNCGALKRVDFRITYSNLPYIVVGGGTCSGGVGPNPYRFTVELYRDGSLIATRSFQAADCWFREWFPGVQATPGTYYAKIKAEKRTLTGWHTLDTGQTGPVTAVSAPAVPDFRVNGTAIPANGTPIVVSGSAPITLDASITTCATKYTVGAEESDAYWNRTHLYEWFRWFDGAPPNDLNLQALSATYSKPPDWHGTDASRQGTPLIGGTLPNGQPRYYRVGVCTGEPTWTCKHALIRLQ
ncbi:MAG TPA: hypothetical protein VF541_20910 [Longimicrobium sp.]|jgi:hypothetical protein